MENIQKKILQILHFIFWSMTTTCTLWQPALPKDQSHLPCPFQPTRMYPSRHARWACLLIPFPMPSHSYSGIPISTPPILSPYKRLPIQAACATDQPQSHPP